MTQNMSESPQTPRALEGIWQAVRAELDGESAPDLVVQHTRLTLAENTYTLHLAGTLADTGHYRLHDGEGGVSRDKPPHKKLTLTSTHNDDEHRTAPKTIHCIYQLAGDRLRIAHSLDKLPPTDFKTSENSARYVVTYRRV